MNEIYWLDINEIINYPFYDTFEISNMAGVGYNKSILWNPQNSLVIFTFKVVETNILAAF